MVISEQAEVEETASLMLMHEPKLHKGLLPVLESKKVEEVVPEPSFKETLCEVHEVEALARDEQEGEEEEEVPKMILRDGFEV